ncbi:Vng6359h (plasmid) [Halobacterium salinarum NRC-1]|uniref:Vng6359h n=3 Tax=Halobacterium salinarum NRC-34001 TaxID=2886895 RepID=Q9HHK0_HALSA|nr:Vng6359h [Halobacterium salinarum NRC-1]
MVASLGGRQPPTAASQLTALRPAVRVRPRAYRRERAVEPPEPAAAGAAQHRSRTGGSPRGPRGTPRRARTGTRTTGSEPRAGTPPGWSHEMTGLDSVAFDIETTGFAVDDQLTVVGFDADIGSRIFLNTDGRAPPSNLEARVNDELASSVSISVQQTERTLLSEMDAFV